MPRRQQGGPRESIREASLTPRPIRSPGICSARSPEWRAHWASPASSAQVIHVMCAMTAWSELPFCVLVWFVGVIALAVMWIRWTRTWRGVELASQRLHDAADDLALLRSSL